MRALQEIVIFKLEALSPIIVILIEFKVGIKGLNNSNFIINKEISKYEFIHKARLEPCRVCVEAYPHQSWHAQVPRRQD